MKRLLTLLALATLPVLSIHAQEEDEVVLKLREALRTLTLQLRDAQGQIANLQATEIANKQEIDKLKAEVKKLTDTAIEERNASANAITELNNKLIERDAEILGQKTAIEKWRKDYTAAIERARKAEADSANKAREILNLERLANDQRYQNVQMYLVGMEVLKRYDNFWFGDAILAREPFVGNTKVKLQNLAQEGQDKLLAARIQEEELKSVKKKKTEPSPTPAETQEQAAATTPEQSQPAVQSPEPTPKPKAQKPKKGERETAWPAASAAQ